MGCRKRKCRPKEKFNEKSRQSRLSKGYDFVESIQHASVSIPLQQAGNISGWLWLEQCSCPFLRPPLWRPCHATRWPFRFGRMPSRRTRALNVFHLSLQRNLLVCHAEASATLLQHNPCNVNRHQVRHFENILVSLNADLEIRSR